MYEKYSKTGAIPSALFAFVANTSPKSTAKLPESETSQLPATEGMFVFNNSAELRTALTAVNIYCYSSFSSADFVKGPAAYICTANSR